MKPKFASILLLDKFINIEKILQAIFRKRE